MVGSRSATPADATDRRRHQDRLFRAAVELGYASADSATSTSWPRSPGTNGPNLRPRVLGGTGDLRRRRAPPGGPDQRPSGPATRNLVRPHLHPDRHQSGMTYGGPPFQPAWRAEVMALLKLFGHGRYRERGLRLSRAGAPSHQRHGSVHWWRERTPRWCCASHLRQAYGALPDSRGGLWSSRRR